jgi:Reverse transcriptase (RNA-dependent DNA polymerase)
VGDEFSEFLAINSGAPQGSVLGPLLFSLFTNDLCRVVLGSRYHVYADDFQFYSSDRKQNFTESVARVNQDIERIRHWAIANGLVLNTNKTQSIVICRNKNGIPFPQPKLSLGNTEICYSQTVKNLGIIMDERLTWLPQVALVHKGVNFALSRLWHFENILPLETKRCLIKTLVIPKLLFGDIIFTQTSEEVTRRFNVTFNACARFVYKVPRFHNVSSLSRRLVYRWIHIWTCVNVHLCTG